MRINTSYFKKIEKKETLDITPKVSFIEPL